MTIRTLDSAAETPLAGSMSPIDQTAASVLHGHDLRDLGLADAGRRLKAQAGDLDEVYFSRARADVRYCPFCPEPHPE